MKSILYRIMTFALVIAIWACQASHPYVHYSNHHNQTHHKSTGTSHKPNPGKQTSASTTVTNKTTQKETSPALNDGSKSGTSTDAKPADAGKLQQLTAVLIAGDVDGANGASTKAYVDGLKEVSQYLKSQGVKVHEYFCPEDDWQHITTLTPQILVYSGHGVYDGSSPPKWVGGFCLSHKFVSSLEIQQQMNLAPNALVLFNHACFSAGSSASDTGGDIGQSEAHRRVAMYAHPFIDKGAGCYFANNFDHSVVDVLAKFFSGAPIGEIYKDTASSWSTILETKSYEYNKSYQIGISRFGKDSYDVAFVGKPGLTVHELVK